MCVSEYIYIYTYIYSSCNLFPYKYFRLSMVHVVSGCNHAYIQPIASTAVISQILQERGLTAPYLSDGFNLTRRPTPCPDQPAHARPAAWQPYLGNHFKNEDLQHPINILLVPRGVMPAKSPWLAQSSRQRLEPHPT